MPFDRPAACAAAFMRTVIARNRSLWLVVLILSAAVSSCRANDQKSEPHPHVASDADAHPADDSVSDDELNHRLDSLVRDAVERERAEKSAAKEARRSDVTEAAASSSRPATDSRLSTAQSTADVPSVVPPVLSKDEDPTIAMMRRAEGAFGSMLGSSRALVDRFDQNFDRYEHACHGQTTGGSWAMTVADPYAPGGLSSFIAGTSVDNETTPECRMLDVDLQTDARRISGILNAVDERARSMGVFPGVMRDLYTKYGVSGAVAAVVR